MAKPFNFTEFKKSRAGAVWRVRTKGAAWKLMLMETEGAAPILESLRSILLSLDTNTSIGSIPSLNDVQIPKEVGDWLKQVRSHLEGFVGKEKETQLRLVNFERMMKQSEHRMKTQESRAEQLESELATAQQLISSLRKIIRVTCHLIVFV